MQVLHQLPTSEDPDVLVGTTVPADAGVYRLRDDLAIVQSVDVFTPVVDDPYDYGRIAAANSLSDVYAMGATPITALNVVSFPEQLPTGVLTEILTGGAEVAEEAGCAIIGGHTVQGPEPMYGLAVTATVHPDELISNQNAQPGDILVLTKPLGMGILTTAHKRDLVPAHELREAVEIMVTLNRDAADAMRTAGAHAATDVTGYGLLGHLHELLTASNLGAEIIFDSVPVLDSVWKYAEENVVPGGSSKNFEYLMETCGDLSWDNSLDWSQQIVLCDAQTSGGLVIAVPEERLDALLTELAQRGVTTRAVIGRLTDDPPGTIRVIRA